MSSSVIDDAQYHVKEVKIIMTTFESSVDPLV